MRVYIGRPAHTVVVTKELLIQLYLGRHREWDPLIIPSTNSSRFSKIGWLCASHFLISFDIQQRKVFSEGWGGGCLNLLSFSFSIIDFLCSFSDRVMICKLGSVSGQS